MTKRKLSHLTPRYILDRLLIATYERRNPAAPWLTPAMNEVLSGWLRPSDVVLEFGSGRSTVWLSTRVGRVITVEENAEWFENVADRLRAMQITNVNQVLARDKDSYLRPLVDAETASLDCVLIDGAYRDQCALIAVGKVRRSGAIVIDNIDRYLPSSSRSPNAINERDPAATEEWHQFSEAVSGWRRIWTSSGVADTCLWLKP
jgi:predicted O-methyltransferase YrrM